MASVYRWSEAAPDNVMDLGEGALASITDETFVLLRPVGVEQLRLLCREFVGEVRAQLRDLMQFTPGQLADWHPSAKYRMDPRHFGGSKNCVALKTNGDDGRLMWMHQRAMIEAMMSLGHVSRTTPSGKPRSSSTKGLGPLSRLIRQHAPAEQRRIIRAAFDLQECLDQVVVTSQTSVLAVEELLNALDQADTSGEILDHLVAEASAFVGRKTAHVHGVPKARGGGRRFGAPWFLMYLAKHGLVLWPRLFDDSENLVPQFLKPFWWTLFTPSRFRDLSRELAAGEGPAVHRHLTLTTNFFHSDHFTPVHLLHLKTTYAGEDDGAKQHHINLAFRATLRHFGTTVEDVESISEYFGGYIRLGRPHAKPFAWVEYPQRKRLARFTSIVGPAPERFPARIHEWVRQLRQVLPRFGVKVIKGKINQLDHWLIFLCTLTEEEAPRTWREISRTHVARYVAYLMDHGGVHRKSCLSTLEQAWQIASDVEAFKGVVRCPIDLDRDMKPSESKPAVLRRTRRQALSEGLLPILVNLNRNDDFAFARRLGRFDREVTDHHSGKRVIEFWPALPIMFDMLFHSAMRGHSVQWVDSGEGDEFLEDESPRRKNPSASRTEGRREGFLRYIDVGPSDRRLGMYMAVAKTGPHEVPYVDPVLAQNVRRMRAWQTRFNPRTRPVASTRSKADLIHGAGELTPQVHALFRDPRSVKGHPPTQGTMMKYYVELLAAAEPIFNADLKSINPGSKYVSLVVDGQPRWDIHSIRVTLVSQLISAGVDPSVVQELLGHKSLQMTFYYDAAAASRTNADLSRAMERVLTRTMQELTEAIERGASPDEIEHIMGGAFSYRGSENDGRSLLRASGSDVPPLIFSHTLCPGGDCDTGGEKKGTKFGPVFRRYGCSRCRHRLTGPAFLNGLKHRADCLIVEIKATTNKEIEMNRERQSLSGSALRRLDDALHRLRDLRNELWLEYAAEYATLHHATAMAKRLDQGGSDIETSALASVGAVATPSHDFVLLNQVLTDADLLPGASVEVPAHTSAEWAAMTLRIAQVNNISDLFLKLDPELSARALRRFGQLLVSHTAGARDEQYEALEGLLSGSKLISDTTHLSAKVDAFRRGLIGQSSQSVATA